VANAVNGGGRMEKGVIDLVVGVARKGGLRFG
jgi:hypothetical protein